MDTRLFGICIGRKALTVSSIVGVLPSVRYQRTIHAHKGGLDLVQPPNEDGMWEDVRKRKKEKGFISRWFLGGR
jgi:hypothetical protein